MAQHSRQEPLQQCRSPPWDSSRLRTSRTLQWSAVRAVASAQRPCIGEGPTSSAAPMYVAATDTIGAIVGTNLERGLWPSFFFLLTLRSIAHRALTDVTFHRLFSVPGVASSGLCLWCRGRMAVSTFRAQSASITMSVHWVKANIACDCAYARK